jgi:hypothetical protein
VQAITLRFYRRCRKLIAAGVERMLHYVSTFREGKGEKMLIILPVTLVTQKSSYLFCIASAFCSWQQYPVDFWLLMVLGIGKEAGNGKRQGDGTFGNIGPFFAITDVVKVKDPRR